MDVLPTRPVDQTPTVTASSSNDSGVISSDFQTFLTMLTTQMNNQDPLNPMDSSEFAVQLATFSGVEQQVLSNDLLKELGGQLGVMNLSQLSGWVGMEARTSSPVNFTGDPVAIYPDIPSHADKATLVVRDSYGREVSRSALNLEADTHTWNGKDGAGALMPDGVYSLSVQSSAGSAPLDSTSVFTYARVEEVRNRNGATELILPGGQVLPSSEVSALRQP